MDITAAKAVAAELFAKAELRPSTSDGDDYWHLEIEDWLKLDAIKHEMARDVRDVSFEGEYSHRDTMNFQFSAGNGFAEIELSVDYKKGTTIVSIVLAQDPSRSTTDGYQGDANQAWTLFRAIPAGFRDDIIEDLKDYGVENAPAIASMLGDAAPEVGPDPVERAAYTPRVGADGMPVFYRP